MDIRKSGMCADLDIMLLAISYGFLHDQGITSMETTGDIGMVDEW